MYYWETPAVIRVIKPVHCNCFGIETEKYNRKDGLFVDGCGKTDYNEIINIACGAFGLRGLRDREAEIDWDMDSFCSRETENWIVTGIVFSGRQENKRLGERNG